MVFKSHPIVLFIDRLGFSVYQDTLINIPRFNFTPDLVVNLDLINKEQFTNLIATFIQVNKIAGSSLVVVLSDDVIFVKNLQNPVQEPTLPRDLKTNLNDTKDNKDEIQSFLEDIPFEEVLARVIKTGEVNRIVAANKDLVMTIISAFVNKGSAIETVVPGYTFGQNANFSTGLNLSNVAVILGNIDVLKSGNLLTDQEKIVPRQDLESGIKGLSTNIDMKPNSTDDKKKPRNLRQYILIGVFIILLTILGVVYFNSRNVQPVPQSAKLENTSVGALSVPTIPPVTEPILTQTPIATVSSNLKNIKISVVQSSQIDERVTNLKNDLLKMGFNNILSQVSEASIPEKSSIVFSHDIPSDLRNSVIGEIKEILLDVSILEDQNSSFTIKITLGKS